MKMASSTSIPRPLQTTWPFSQVVIGYVGYFYQYYGNGFRRDNIEASTYDATYFQTKRIEPWV